MNASDILEKIDCSQEFSSIRSLSGAATLLIEVHFFSAFVGEVSLRRCRPPRSILIRAVKHFVARS